MAESAVERDVLADGGGRAAEFFAPETVSENDGIGGAGRIVLVGEGAAEHGRNTEKRESGVGDVESFEAFGFGKVCEIDPVAIVDADVLKGLVCSR